MNETRLVQIRLSRVTALALKLEAAGRDSTMQAMLAEAAEGMCSERVRKLAEYQIERHPGDPV